MPYLQRLFFLLVTLAGSLLCAQVPSTAAAPAQPRCTSDHAASPEADLLLAGERYKEAEAAYRQQLVAQPSQPEAALGLARSLVGQNKVAEAQAEAAKMLTQQPRNALADVAASETSFRAANIGDAFAHAKSALMLNPCEARAALALARLYSLTGLHAESARMRAQAHALRPNDQLITRTWIQGLPAAERQKQLALFLSSQPALSESDLHGYQNQLQHLQARKPGECRITSKAEQTQTAMRPVFGEHTRPIAYGLDVSFDGKRRRMQIDTGASGIVLTAGAARGLGLQPEYTGKAGGIGDEGERESYLSHVHSIRIGEIEVENCMVEVVSKAHLDVDGLIGMDVFARWLVTLDYQAAQLRLTPLPARPGEQSSAGGEGTVPASEREPDVVHNRYVAPEMKDWLSIARIGHEILLPAVLSRGAPVHYMIMDTGAQSSSFALPLAQETGTLSKSDVRVTGISGNMKQVFETHRTGLIVGNLLLPPEEYFAFDLTSISHNSGFEVGGLLGLPTLQRLTIQIDYRDNLLKLSYDPKRDQQRF